MNVGLSPPSPTHPVAEPANSPGVTAPNIPSLALEYAEVSFDYKCLLRVSHAIATLELCSGSYSQGIKTHGASGYQPT